MNNKKWIYDNRIVILMIVSLGIGATATPLLQAQKTKKAGTEKPRQIDKLKNQ